MVGYVFRVSKLKRPVSALCLGFIILKACTLSSSIIFFPLCQGTERDYDRAAEAYIHAKSQSNAQAMFNLGYMHEHGLGLPFDLHLAKRYYDQAQEIDSAAKLPVTLALTSLWIRKNYPDGFLVSHSVRYMLVFFDNACNIRQIAIFINQMHRSRTLLVFCCQLIALPTCLDASNSHKCGKLFRFWFRHELDHNMELTTIQNSEQSVGSGSLISIKNGTITCYKNFNLIG